MTLLNARAEAVRPWVWPVLIALLAITASLSGVGNQFAQDDIPIIWKNSAAHDLKTIGRVFTEPYWPPPWMPALYRPLASATFRLQWFLGGGSPLMFRVVSYLLYALAAVAVFRMARLRLPLVPAAACAALFAVHPVHVEAVAVAVNQGELWVAILTCTAVIMYVNERSRGGPLSGRTQLALAALYLMACLFKDNALILPGLLVAAEVFLVRTGESARHRIAYGRQPLLLLLLVASALFFVRTRVLSGHLIGDRPADALVGLTMGERALTMLSVVPEWFRLLFWPAHLQADYSPGEIVAQTSWGWGPTLGLILLLVALLSLIAAWRRTPVIAFGIAWAAIALFPVHNVLVPTGIVLAERTLFLTSVGTMLILGAVGALLLERLPAKRRGVLGVAVMVLLLLGILRSATRHPVWSDQFGLWYRTANEHAPRSYLAHEAMAEAYFQVGMEAMGEQEYQLSIHFAPPHLPRPMAEYAERLRLRGHCYPAAELYQKVVTLQPNHAGALASLTACLVDLGHYREATFRARMGISLGWQRAAFRQALVTADSALRSGAPAGTVRIRVASDTVAALMQIGKDE